jgi:hypothetical protein
MKRRAQGTTYGKRPVSGTPSAPPSNPGAFSSSDAHSLARQIASEQERYRISSIRLVSAGVCCLIVTDSRTGIEHTLESSNQWHQLRSAATG